MPRTVMLAKSIQLSRFSGLPARTVGVTPGGYSARRGSLSVVTSERRNPNPCPPRPHLSSLIRHIRASHPSHSCTLNHEEPVFDGFPRRQTCSESRPQFPRKPQRCRIFHHILRASLQRSRHQSACDGFECPDCVRRPERVVSVMCAGDVVPSIA
jgi:hypothetical protein